MMNGQANREFRVAVIAALVQRSKAGLGRTGLMKLGYFLQTLKDVPLGYSFRLYTYGPYEAQVLEDLKVAEFKGAVRSTVIGYPTGYGYEITPGEDADATINSAREELAAHAAALDWVLDEFGQRTAIDLEMAGTIVYVDRASQASDEKLSISEMAARVHAIKPRLALSRIETEAKSLLRKGLLTSVH
jgi:hypothetical protein